MIDPYTISLDITPIWMQQPEEPEDHYKAFCDWVSADGYASAVRFARERGLHHQVPFRNRWQERADKYQQDIASRIGHGIQTALEKLNVKAIEAAHELLSTREVEEGEQSEMERTDEGKVRRTIRRRKKYGPSERIVAILLQNLIQEAGSGQSVDLGEVIRAMVEDTDEGSDTPTDSGMEEQ